MSSAEIKIITCPECGQDSEVKIFRTVNVTTDAELHDQVVNGSLFRFRCPHCGKPITSGDKFCAACGGPLV